MPYKRPEDQYQVNKAHQTIEELKQEKQKQKILCTFSTVKVYKKIKFGKHGTEHVGTLVHVCGFLKGHSGNCECVCGVQFKGF